MDAQLANELRSEWEDALSSIETVLDERPGEHMKELSLAVRALVRARDRLIDVRRSEGLSPEGEEHLRSINAMLSVVASLEYPLAGLHWQRIKLVHEGLSQMLGKEQAPT